MSVVLCSSGRKDGRKGEKKMEGKKEGRKGNKTFTTVCSKKEKRRNEQL